MSTMSQVFFCTLICLCAFVTIHGKTEPRPSLKKVESLDPDKLARQVKAIFDSQDTTAQKTEHIIDIFAKLVTSDRELVKDQFQKLYSESVLKYGGSRLTSDGRLILLYLLQQRHQIVIALLEHALRRHSVSQFSGMMAQLWEQSSATVISSIPDLLKSFEDGLSEEKDKQIFQCIIQARKSPIVEDLTKARSDGEKLAEIARDYERFEEEAPKFICDKSLKYVQAMAERFEEIGGFSLDLALSDIRYEGARTMVQYLVSYATIKERALGFLFYELIHKPSQDEIALVLSSILHAEEDLLDIIDGYAKYTTGEMIKDIKEQMPDIYGRTALVLAGEKV